MILLSKIFLIVNKKINTWKDQNSGSTNFCVYVNSDTGILEFE